ncbi:MAG: amino acid racemase [Pseudomonadota bacterium]
MPDRRPLPTPRTIGVLGGMGPQATVQFMQRVIDLVSANDDRDHVPLLVDQNPQVPSRIEALIDGDGADPAPVLAAMATRLEAAGAQALVMPCNTAHAFSPEVRAAVTIPFLSMVELTVGALAATHPGARIGMLASPAVRIARVFDAPMTQHGLEPLYARDEAALLGAIRTLKCDTTDPSANKSALDVARSLRADGADLVLVSCSEFSLLTPALCEHAPVIDSLDVLVEATVSFSRFGAGQPRAAQTATHEPGAGGATIQSASTTRETAP